MGANTKPPILTPQRVKLEHAKTAQEICAKLLTVSHPWPTVDLLEEALNEARSTEVLTNPLISKHPRENYRGYASAIILTDLIMMVYTQEKVIKACHAAINELPYLCLDNKKSSLTLKDIHEWQTEARERLMKAGAL